MKPFLKFLLAFTAAQLSATELTFQTGNYGQAERAETRLAPGETLTLTGRGQESYWQIDDGAYAAFETDEPNFTFTARIASVEGTTASPKYGIMMRSGLGRFERMVTLRHDGWEGNRCLQLFNRYEAGDHPEAGARRMLHAGLFRDWKEPAEIWLRMERRYPYVHLYASRDGEDWTRLPNLGAMLEQEVWLGLQVTGGGDGRTPVTVAYDNISFQVDPAPEHGYTRESLGVDWVPDPVPYTYHMAKVEPGRGRESITHNAFLVKPDDMPWEDVRAVFVAAGSKEIALRDRTRLAWDHGEEGRRRPEGMEDWEGTFSLPPLPPHWDVLAQYGVVRLGGVRSALDFEANMRELARVTGQPHIEFLPGFATGASFGGGRSHQFADRFPDRAIASAPMIIGIPAGLGSENSRRVPTLYVWGSIDGRHLPDSAAFTPRLRELGALSASAPMFGLGHFGYNSDAIIWPFFLEMLEERFPEDWDRQAIPELKNYGPDEGWIVSLENLTGPGMYPVQNPPAYPIAEAPEDLEYPGWLPNRRMVHLWRHFVSAQTDIRIVYPTFNQAQGFHNVAYFDRPGDVSSMRAGESFPVIAAGPTGEDVEHHWHFNYEPIEPEWTDPENPYHIRLGPQEPGLHVLTLEVRRGDRHIFSRPISVVFHP